MGLFRPYEQGKHEPVKTATKTAEAPAEPAASATSSQTTSPKTTSPKTPMDAEAASASSATTDGPRVRTKQGPTRSRAEAEAARLERLHPTLTKKEQRAQSRSNDRVERQRRWTDTENSPERVLLRDYVDARWTVSEFVIPLAILDMAASIGLARFGLWAGYATAAFMWALFAAMILNVWFLWRGFKRELADRVPGASPRGLLNYMINRAMWIRRFRRPSPRINRGDAY